MSAAPAPPAAVTVRLLDPARARADVEALLPELNRARAASGPADWPGEPVETLAVTTARVLAPWSAEPLLLLVAEDPAAGLVGHALLELPERDNRHLGLLEVHVLLEQRRRGVGRRLAAAAVEHARTAGRRAVLLEAREASPAAAFATALGATCRSWEMRRDQDFTALDPVLVRRLRAEAEEHAAGYRLVGWTGATPPERRSDLAVLTLSLNDAPMGSLDYEDETCDAGRIEARDRFATVSGLRQHGLLAYAPDGAPAGFTEVLVADEGRFGFQWGTGVDPAHRGHRLGLLLKAAMCEWLREREPALQVVSTGNSVDNAHMVAINDRLGYRPVERVGEWQLDL